MEQPGLIKPGDKSPSFILKDQNDQEFNPAEHKGKIILLSFHPLAWTQYCADQMVSLEMNKDTFLRLDVIPVGLSVDSKPCKKAWAESLGITSTLLLCDFWPHGAVACQYGIFREENGFSERANIILDENMKVVFIKIYPIHSVPDIQEIIAFVKDLKR